jgi:hypothetical protein
MDGPLRALASPFAYALDVFLGVVAVAVAVAKGGGEEAPFLAYPQPLGRDAELAGRLGDPVGGAPVLSHATTVRGADSFGYRKSKKNYSGVNAKGALRQQVGPLRTL